MLVYIGTTKSSSVKISVQQFRCYGVQWTDSMGTYFRSQYVPKYAHLKACRRKRGEGVVEEIA